MIRLLSLLILCGLFTVNSKAQRVETLVNGPSTFDDGLALDSAGNIYASRYYGNTITKITPSGETNIFSSGFTNPNAIAFDNDGLLLVPSAGGGRVERVKADGSKETIINGIHNPTGVAVDSNGNIYISQYQLSRIIKIDTEGNDTTYLTGGLLDGPVGLAFDDEGSLFIGNFNDGRILRYDEDTGLVIVGDVPGWLGSFALNGDHIYATAFQRNQIYRIDKEGGTQNIYAGTGSSGSKDGLLDEATFDGPNGIVASHTGDTLYISDFESRSLRMITGLLPNNPKIKVLDSLDFGEVEMDNNKVYEQFLKIENTGNDTLVIEQVRFADSLFSSNKQELQVPPYSIDSLSITFNPVEEGNIQSSVFLQSNAQTNEKEITLIARVKTVTSISDEQSSIDGIPDRVVLHQNYPNPFNPSTSIQFELPKATQVQLSLYNIIGQQVKTMISEYLPAGYHTISIDMNKYPSGTYIYILDVGDQRISQKMLLIK